MKNKSPFLLWLISVLIFTASAYYFIQAVRAIRSWNLLLILQYRFGPIYPVFQGVLLGSAFLAGGIFLLKRLAWAPTFTAVLVLIAAAWSWLDRTILSQNPRPFPQQIFGIASTLLVMGLILGSLWSLQPSMLSSKTEALEESQDSSSSSGGKDEH
jgi:hypothetical protein